MNYLEQVNKELRDYVENEIFPIYSKNDSGHQIDHILYVIERSLKFSKQFPNINLDMVYVIAAYHDIAHHIDKDHHEELSAKVFYEDEKMKEVFDSSQRKTIKEAIEDHRASLEYEPRSDYGKIVSSADRTTSIDSVIQRTHAYTLDHFPEFNLVQMIDRAYQHMLNKYGTGGYAKHYCKDEEYEQFLKEVEIFANDKWRFIKCYFEVNEISSIKEKAKVFALHAHRGQVRKSEKDKPMITHPLGVGKILEEYGYSDALIAAGYLHDVVEDTPYTIEEIQEVFGEEVASLVKSATEPDKSLSWEERKTHTIQQTKTLPLSHKLLICADKIHNLEDLMISFQKKGKKDFSAFKRGEEQQKWYYTSVYESMIHGEDENLPIFQRLKKGIDTVFFNKQENFARDTLLFVGHRPYYEKLQKLHAQKMELQRLKKLCSLQKPFVIEFSGTPRTGKTTTIHNLEDFFQKGGFRVSLVEEFTTSSYYKKEIKKELEGMSLSKKNLMILDLVYQQLLESIQTDSDIILIDRSINDRQIWNYRRYLSGDMPVEDYLQAKEKYRVISKELIDFLVMTYADPITSLRRDYLSSLALEERSFLNTKNIEDYNQALKDLETLFQESVDDYLLLDTSYNELNDVSVNIASELLPAIRKKYIKSFKDQYHLP